MKCPGTRRFLLFMLILTIGLETATGTSSFWKWKASISTNRDVGQVEHTEIPALSEFTACLDVFFDNDARTTAWSYSGPDGENPELGFNRHIDTFGVFHFGTVYTVKATIKEKVWNIVCLQWKRKTMQLEVYVNGTRIYDTTTSEDRMLKSNGSLVLGAKHTNKGGTITTETASMNGLLYNFQMWNYTRSQEELLDCSEGNLISWTKETWNFRRTSEDVQLRCANASVTPTPTASTTTPTPTASTTTPTPTSTTTPTPTASTTTPTPTTSTTTPTPTASTTTPTPTASTTTPTPTASTTTPTPTSTTTPTPTASTTTPTPTASTTTPTPTASTTTPTPTASTTTPTTTASTTTPTPTASTTTPTPTASTTTPTPTASTTTPTPTESTTTPTPTASTTTPTPTASTTTPTPTASTTTPTQKASTTTPTPTASTTTPTPTASTTTPTPTTSTTTPTPTSTTTPTPTASTTTPTPTASTTTPTPTASTTVPTASTTTPTPTASTTTTTPTASTTTPTPTASTTTPTPTASTTTPTPTPGTTSARAPKPSPENSVATQTFPAATESLTSVTSTPAIFSTSVTPKGTTRSSSSDNLTSAPLPDTLPTSPSAKPKFSTKAATTESLSGNDQLTNSSVDIPTGSNVSTTGNISSTYHSPPGLRTTSAGPITSWNSTIRQQSTEGKTTPGPQVVSTRTPIISTQPDIMSKPMTGTTLKVMTTSPTTKSVTPSTLTNVSSASTSSSSPSTVTNVSSASTSSSSPSTVTIVSSASTSSSSPSTVTNVSSASTSSSSPSTLTSVSNASTSSSSPSTVKTPSSRPSSTPHVTLGGVTESPISHSGTTYIPSSSSMKPLPANVVSFYVVQVKFTSRSTDVMDEQMASSVIQNTMKQLLNNTEFAAVQIIVSRTESNEPGNLSTQNNDKKKRETVVDSGDSNPPGYIAKSIIRANSSQNTEALAVELGSLLMEGFKDTQLNQSLIAENVTTDVLAAEYCRSESTSYEDFPYEWPETSATEKASLHCHTNLNNMATRECYINVTTLKTEWGDPNYTKCVPSSFGDLENVTVTPDNANFLSMQIFNMTKKADSLPEEDIRIILNKVSEIIALGEIDLETAKVHVDVINLVLQKGNTTLRLFANKILNLMEEVGFKINFTGDTTNVTADSMALLVSKTFNEVYFAVTTYLEGNVEITLQQFPPQKAVAFIHLPKSIQNQAEISSAKVQFNFIGRLSPFQDYESSVLELNTYIISASFEGINVENLMEPIGITLWHVKENVEDHPVMCAFWDFTKKNNLGGWNTSGCSVTFTNKEYTSCSCNHLTHFGVLLDLSGAQINPLDEHILSLLTYVGCGIASIFLGIALVTYGMFRQLRRDYPSKILMNLSFSLLMLNLLFLVNNWLSLFGSQGLCVSVAALLHYFLLTSFTWMGLEAVHMYFAFVKVFNAYVHKYVLKLCIAGWGIPLVVVVAVLCVDVNFYGIVTDNKEYEFPGGSDASFCWIRNDIVFYVAVVSYFGMIFLVNISMFIVVLLQIKSLKSTRIKDWKALFLHDIKNTLSLVFLLGLTWGFAFFAWGPVRVAFLYLFAIFNTLQGFFIFVFHCLIKENVRRHWKMYLCCGRCRLDTVSDWSRLSNAETRYNGRIHLTPSDSYQSTRSNNTASTSNASSLSSLSRDAFYGNSFVNGGGIFNSSAHTAPSYHASAYPNNRKLMFMDLDAQSNRLK